MSENNEQRASLETPGVPLNASNITTIAYGVAEDDTGYGVTPAKALTLTPLYAGIRLISSTVGSMPLITYERLERGKRRATDHPIYRLLKTSPNDLYTAVVFWETLVADAILYGHAYAYIERDTDFVPSRLLRLDPQETEHGVVGGQILYATKVGGEVRYLDQYEVLHIPSLYGKSVVDLFRQAIGLAKSTEKFGARFFGSGAAIRGVLSHPTTLSDKARNNLRDGFDNLFKGLNNSHKVAILEDGTKFTPMSFSPEDSQFLATRQFQVSEVARMLTIPENKIGGSQPNLYANREANELTYIQDSIQPWLARIEQENNRKLYANTEQDKYFCEFLIENRLRGDEAARGVFYNSQFQIGAITPNEIRELENRMPYEGAGDEPVINGAYLRLADVGKPPAAPVATPPQDQAAEDQQPVEENAKGEGDAEKLGTDPQVEQPQAEKLGNEPQPDTAGRSRLERRFARLLVDALSRAVAMIHFAAHQQPV